MTQMTAHRAMRFGAHCAIGLLAVSVLLISGCRSRKRRPGLLGPRAVIPAPYVEPGAAADTGAPPPEPTFDVSPMTAPSVDLEEELVQPAEIDEFPAVQDTTPQALPPETPDEDIVVLPPEVDSQNLTYTVRKGDSLWEIGQMYGVTVAELAAENNMDPENTLHPGDILRLPPGARRRDPGEIQRSRPQAEPAGAGTTTPKSSRIAKQPIPSDGIYTVKAGDNLWTISRRFGVKSQDIIAWNNLKTDVLQIGQKLTLRSPGSSRRTPSARDTARETVEEPADRSVDTARQPDDDPEDETQENVDERVDTGAAEETPVEDDETAPEIEEREPVPGALDLPKKLAHTVTEGETLQIIADMYGTTVEAIKKENPAVKSDADLKPNLKLMVPYR